jgi:hypothetical protein
MFISSEYRNQIEELVCEAQEVKVAVAFWGKDSEIIFTSHPKKPIRIICNLQSGGTNPEPIRKLKASPNIEIRQLEKLHAKVVFSENSAIVGSANLSIDGLSRETDKDSGWIEAGIKTEATDQLEQIGAWFENQWKLSREIEDTDLEKAQERWNLRPRHEFDDSSKKLFCDLSLREILDGSVYLAMYKDDYLSDEAEQTLKQVKKDATKTNPQVNFSNLEAFEEWEDLPTDCSIISIFVGSNGGARVDGSYRRLPMLDRPVGKKSHSIQVVFKESKVLNMPFDKKEEDYLKKRLASRIKKFHLDKSNPAEYELLYDALKNDG